MAILVADWRDFQLAEDVLQDAVIAALTHWPAAGLPRSPSAWLLQTARRKAIDRFRRDTNYASKLAAIEELTENQIATDEQEIMDVTIPDERLRLIFTCCHPALPEAARVALTLRSLGGLTTPEIARAFLVGEATMAQRIVRAKRKIKAAGIPYRVPPPELWPERLASVLAVVYFIFNEGYAASSGDHPTRADLCQEAIRLGQILVTLAPDAPEAGGLLALMLLHDARRPARADANGDLITLEDQDRGLWERAKIDQGIALLRAALGRRAAGAYQIQAAISAVHASAESYEATNWHEITDLYGKLQAVQPSPVIELNGIVALSHAKGAGAGLDALAALETRADLEHYQPYHAARADLYRRAGKHTAARAAYNRAVDMTDNAADRRFLSRRLAALEE